MKEDEGAYVLRLYQRSNLAWRLPERFLEAWCAITKSGRDNKDTIQDLSGPSDHRLDPHHQEVVLRGTPCR